ncbi:MAG: SRPBCC family protein [Rubrobacter sp.]|nr:SRPBCC family protein [Rubrobacter sp.]
MKMENEFTVEAPVEQAWEALLDLERITPCLPGAALREESGDEYKGTMTIRLGPVTQKYNGAVSFEETDEEARRVVLKADGKDARGQGTASATITSTLSEEDGGTKVHVETDMHLTGRAAQFGRGVQQEVATKLINQFADCLEKEIMGENEKQEPEETPETESAAEPEETEAAASANGSGAESEMESEAEPGAEESDGEEEKPKRRVIQQDHDVEPLDLGEASRDAVLKRVVPLAAGIGVLVVVFWLLRRRRN